MKIIRLLPLLVVLLLICPLALAQEEYIPPQWEVPEYVTWLLDIADEEVGYKEGPHGYSKYGEWSGDPYAQWCAEFVCWCVDQVDRQHGTQLLNHVYPMYSAQNVGKNWFIKEGRYITRWGNIDGWGYQWLKGEDKFLKTGDYIPQPGDWMFFTWTSGTDTDHVAMVEYCTRKGDDILIHVIEGNNPTSVQRAAYSLYDKSILGYGTVHDVADVTMRYPCEGEKVRQFQNKLIYIGAYDGKANGVYGSSTVAAVKTFQQKHGLKVNGIANIATQQLVDTLYNDLIDRDPAYWTVVDEE
ncbi:MAG: peptidoglycan-binding protein [Clostridia bacterium]|nr:peptidoglycan-binding protein [Clostridia bacterium]